MDFRWLIYMHRDSRKIRELFNIVCRECGQISCYDPDGCRYKKSHEPILEDTDMKEEAISGHTEAIEMVKK